MVDIKMDKFVFETFTNLKSLAHFLILNLRCTKLIKVKLQVLIAILNEELNALFQIPYLFSSAAESCGKRHDAAFQPLQEIHFHHADQKTLAVRLSKVSNYLLVIIVPIFFKHVARRIE